ETDAESFEQCVEVIAPRDRDGDVPNGILEDQIPSDDPRDEFAKRRVGIGVRTACLRDHRRKFRVAEGGKRARGPEQDKRKDERGPGAITNYGAIGSDLSSGGGADGAE